MKQKKIDEIYHIVECKLDAVDISNNTINQLHERIDLVSGSSIERDTTNRETLIYLENKLNRLEETIRALCNRLERLENSAQKNPSQPEL